MKSRISSRVVLLSIFFFVFAFSYAKKMPKIVFDKTVIELGEVKVNSTKTFDFTFTNKGSGKLFIHKVSTGCGCSKAEFPKEGIPSGGKGKITVTFNSTNFQPTRVKKILTVITNCKKATQKLEYNITISY